MKATSMYLRVGLVDPTSTMIGTKSMGHSQLSERIAIKDSPNSGLLIIAESCL